MTLECFRDRKSQDELLHLWTTVRPICRQFKEAIEEIFRTEHLPKTRLHLDASELFLLGFALDENFRQDLPLMYLFVTQGSSNVGIPLS